MVGTTILHYHIKEELGRGGMGVVYKAEDTKLKREVAIKFLPRHIAASEEERERFKIEAQAAAALNHPNITTIYAIEEHDDELFIVMEFIEGQELRKLLIDNGQLSIENCLNIATQIAEGLQAAHAKGIVHRDIKSSNIMITEDGKVKIMDFGLAKMANPSSSRHLTRQNTTLGTVPYMSPEQVTGAPIDQRSDIWSLGIIVYEMITGQLPFQQPYEAAELYAIVNDPYPSPLEHNPNLPPVLMTLLEGALAKLPEERFQNMEEVLGCLRVRPISERGGENPERRSQEEKVGKKESISTLTSHRQFLISGAVLLVLAVLIFLISRNLLQRNSPLPVEKSIVVLPLQSEGDRPTVQSFSDGLEELIYRTLTRMEGNNPDMWVIPASDMKEQQVTSAREAFDVFGANLVLQGKFSRTSQNLKLQLKLIQPNTYQILRSMDISLPVEEVTHFQEKVIDALRSLLELPVRPEQDRMQSAGLTSIGSAYQSYLEGKGLLLNYDTPSNVEQSIDLFKQAIAMDSVYALAYAGLGEAYWRKYEHTQEPHWTEEAIRYCEEALRINNYLPQVYLTLGIIRRGRGEYELSREALENVIRVEPQNGDAYRELASTYSLMKNSSAAEKMYQKAIEHHPNYWANYYDLGRFYYHQGRYEEAVANFQKVTEIAPYNYKGFRNLGVVKLLLDDYPGARKNLEQSIAIKPNYGAYSNLGTLHFIRKEYQQAARMFEQALEMNANFYALWGNLASCYAMLPDESFKAAPTFQQAINLAERQLTVNPNNSNILKSLASYYAHLNNSAKATELIERVLQLAGDDLDVQFRAAEVYGRLGQMDKALNMLQQLVKKGFSRKMILQSPVFQNFQEDERFKEALFSQ